jgi:hypothetical protein
MNNQELKNFQAHFDSCEPEYKIITELLDLREKRVDDQTYIAYLQNILKNAGLWKSQEVK